MKIRIVAVQPMFTWTQVGLSHQTEDVFVQYWTTLGWKSLEHTPGCIRSQRMAPVANGCSSPFKLFGCNRGVPDAIYVNYHSSL